MAESGRDTIGKYRVVAELGLGGMARVLLTMVTGPADVQKLLVVKQLRDEYAQDPEFLTMFLDEARLAARLNHANVVHTYEVFAEDGQYYIAMDYLEGQPLHRVLHRVGRKEMPLDVHLRILAQVLAGLEYAHSLGDFDGTPLHVVHRDVSPQNVFVTYDGQVKLVDFGIAKAAGGAAFTREGMVKGKIAYIAPEQARAEPVDRRADIFSVGVMLWEALAGQRLSRGQSELVLLNQRISGSEPSIRECAPEQPEALLAICERAMALEPADRFATAAEFQTAIEDYLDSSDRRVGAKDVAALMIRTFSEERQTIRERIEQQVKLVREAQSGKAAAIPILALGPAVASSADGTPSGPVGRAVSAGAETTRASLASRPDGGGPDADPSGPKHARGAGGPVADGDGEGPDTGQTTPSRLNAAASIQPRTSPAEAGPRRWAAVGLIGAVAVAVALYALRGPDDAPASSNSLPDSARPSETHASPGTSTSSSSPVSQPGETVRIRFVATPAEATILLDGTPVAGNPFEATFPNDSSVHRVRVEAKGHEPAARMVSYDRDQEVRIELEPTGVMPGKPRKGAAPSPSSTGGVATEPAMGSDLGAKTARTARPIDETDPYKR